MDRQIKHNLTGQPGYDWGMTDKPFLTIGEMADILQVSSRTVYNLIYNGTLRACRLAVRKEVAKRTKTLTEAKRTVELERDSAMAMADTFETERDTALRQLREQKTGEQHRIDMAVSRATEDKDKTMRMLQEALKTSRDILNIIADILYKASEVFRRAVDAIIRFGTEKYKSVFGNDEAADIKSVMQSYDETTEQQKAVGAWLCDYAEHLQPFDEIKHRHTLNEVGDVAEGRYDWKIERAQRGGISM